MDYNKILNKIKLSDQEKSDLNNNIEKTLLIINKEFQKQSIKAEVVLGGSAAKSTMLKGDFDVDLFARFDYKYKNENISDILKPVLKKLFKIQSLQGSREYFQFKADNLQYEVVPVLKISNYTQACNVTDASFLHVDWVKKTTDKKPELIDQIILTKAFLKANKLYGAESYIKGFSGHVVDILVIYYGGFEPLLKATQKWKPNQKIDPEKHGQKLNQAKLGPLIIIDPVQPERNAAAALGSKKLDQFISIAKQYLKKPSKVFFEKKKITTEQLRKKAGRNKLIILEMTPLKGKDDIIGAKMMKSFEHIKKKLEEFKIIDAGWEWNKPDNAICWYILEIDKLPKDKEHIGPPLKSKKHVKIFNDTHKITYIKEGRWFATVNREYTDPTKLISDLIKSEYIEERLKAITLLR